MSSKKGKTKQVLQKKSDKKESLVEQEPAKQESKENQEKKENKENQEKQKQNESSVWNYCIISGLIILVILVFGLRWHEEFYRKHGFITQQKDLYYVLQVEPTADITEIKNAHRELVKKWHPDRNQNCMGCAEKFQEITEAYDILSDPQKRASYDSQIRLAIPIESKTKFLTEEMLDSSEFLLIQVLTNHCDQPCKKLSPFWEYISQLNEFRCVKFVRVDGDSSLAQKLPYRIKLHPSIIAYHRDLGSQLYPYSFHYTQQDIQQFITESMPNVIREVNKVSFETYFANNLDNLHTVSVIFKTPITLCMKNEALKYKDFLSYISLPTSKKNNTIVVWHKKFGRINRFEPDQWKQAIKYALKHTSPDLTRDNFDYFCSSMCVIFVKDQQTNVDVQEKQLQSIVYQNVKLQPENQVQVAVVDPDKHKISFKSNPIVIIVDNEMMVQFDQLYFNENPSITLQELISDYVDEIAKLPIDIKGSLKTKKQIDKAFWDACYYISIISIVAIVVVMMCRSKFKKQVKGQSKTSKEEKEEKEERQEKEEKQEKQD